MICTNICITFFSIEEVKNVVYRQTNEQTTDKGY